MPRYCLTPFSVQLVNAAELPVQPVTQHPDDVELKLELDCEL